MFSSRRFVTLRPRSRVPKNIFPPAADREALRQSCRSINFRPYYIYFRPGFRRRRRRSSKNTRTRVPNGIPFVRATKPLSLPFRPVPDRAYPPRVSIPAPTSCIYRVGARVRRERYEGRHWSREGRGRVNDEIYVAQGLHSVVQ